MTADTRSGVIGEYPLSVVAPFDFRQSLAFLESFPPTKGEQVIEEDSFIKAISIGGKAYGFEVKSASDDISMPSLSVTVYGKGNEDAAKEVVGRVQDFLCTTDDLREFYELAKTDPPFGGVTEHRWGMHHVRFLTYPEACCWSILGARQPVPVGRRMKRDLTQRYGRSVIVRDTEHWAFPEFEDMVGASEEELVEVVRNRQRGRYLYNVIQACSDIDPEWLATAPYEDAEKKLRTITGVGEWAAAFILLRGLGRMECMPKTLAPMIKAAEALYGPGVDMDRIFEHYGHWIGYWAYYLRNEMG